MNNTLKRVLSGFAITGLMLIAVAPSADAASILLYDGSTYLVIHDNDGVAVPLGNTADQNPILGFVSFTGSIGVFTFTVASGQTKPLIGSEESPRMDLFVNATSSTSGTLSVLFSETDFGPSSAFAHATAAGVIGVFTPDPLNTISYRTLQDVGNSLFVGAEITSDSSGAGPFLFDSFGVLTTPGGPYSLTQEVSIHHNSAQTSFFSGALTVPDGGWAITLLGFALMGVEGLRRKFA